MIIMMVLPMELLAPSQCLAGKIVLLLSFLFLPLIERTRELALVRAMGTPQRRINMTLWGAISTTFHVGFSRGTGTNKCGNAMESLTISRKIGFINVV